MKMNKAKYQKAIIVLNKFFVDGEKTYFNIDTWAVRRSIIKRFLTKEIRKIFIEYYCYFPRQYKKMIEEIFEELDYINSDLI